ncbi:DoxX family protein [Rhodobacteraceae bacterium RKSG542]|uniref:DoxX family protein n=1 Tax=Pseudovibrio flavus TaxID=2529854 RepID=UPI0012BD205B|nr:DoxX family protein [Pseudovibrio flavus]MTI16528.1 DoxX family protein [Pseudovibrio flavus]
MGIVRFFAGLYNGFFYGIERLAGDWFLGAVARFVFASTLLLYFWNSAMTKIGPGLFGFLEPTTGAYAQILPQITEAAGYDTTAIAFFPYGLIVIAGTLAEIILPALVVLGLFTRAASLGMIGFLIVMSYVDIVGHGADATAIGGLFDGNPSGLILDQRMYWGFVLLYLVVRGAGALSLDAIFSSGTKDHPRGKTEVGGA